MSVPMALTLLLNVLGDCFQSIDIRCAVMRGPIEWLNVLTTIRISARPPESVLKRYQELESGGQRRIAGPFRILWQVFPFDRLKEVLEEFGSAQLRVEGEVVRLPEQILADEIRRQFEHAPSLIASWNGNRWPATFYFPSSTRTTHFSDPEIYAGVKRSGWGSAEEMAAHFLGLNHQHLGSTTIPVGVSVEMPAAIEIRAASDTLPDIIVRTVPKLRNFNLYLRTDRDGRKPFVLPLEEIGRDGIWTLYRNSLKLDQLELDDTFSCTLSHDVVPVLDEVSGCFRNFIPVPYLNPLLFFVRQFWDMQRFRDRLELPFNASPKRRDHNAQHVFQESVAQLLTLAGFQTIDLGKEEFIKGEGTEVQRGTLDILAYHASSKAMILGACTITPPEAKDIQGVIEVMSILRKRLPPDAQVLLAPIIFSVQEQEHPNHEEVRIFNSRKIRKLRALLENGQEDQFIRSFQWPYQDVLSEL